MKKTILILIPLLLTKLVIHLFGNRNYGFHRDELLHLSVSKHLDWGYMEFPPMIGWLGRLSEILFDHSLSGTRFLSTLAGLIIIATTVLLVRRMGGKPEAQWLAGLAVLSFIPFFRNHTLFQPVAFDQMWWTLGYFYFALFLIQKEKKYLFYMGVILGLGMLTKYTMVMWAFGVFIGFFFHQKATVYRSKWIYLSGVLSLVIFSPNLFWQINNDLPYMMHLEVLHRDQLGDVNTWDFGLDQLTRPVSLLIAVAGITGTFLNQNLQKFRPVSIAAMVTFFAMWSQNAKSYYIFSLYPILFALGAIYLTHFNWFKKPALIIMSSILILPCFYWVPRMTPVLSISSFVKKYDISNESGRYELTGDYADMFGWEEQVALIDSIYRSLPQAERSACMLWAENYGEAGALKILGQRYNLPPVLCRHGSFWLWGYGDAKAKVWISLANEKEAVEYVFEETKLITTIQHPYAIDEEVNVPVYLCRKPKINFEEWWTNLRNHIFD